MNRIFGAIGLIALMTVISSKAASFECTKATSQVERLICLDGELSKLDDVMASAYRRAFDAPDMAEKVRSDQRQWLGKRKSCSDSACIKHLYVDRIVDLLMSVGGCHDVTDSNWSVYERCVESRYNVLRSSMESDVKELLARKGNEFQLPLTKSQENWERYAEAQCSLQWNSVRGGMGYTYWMACMTGKYELRRGELGELHGALPDKED